MPIIYIHQGSSKIMGKYMYPIVIDYSTKRVKYEHLYAVYTDNIPFEWLIQRAEIGDTLQVSEEHGGLLRVLKERDETAEEKAARIEKEKQYMRNYNKYHNIKE